MPTRRSRSDLKQLVLTAGVEQLVEEAPRFAIDTLTYKTVFDRLARTRGVKVTHASVHERIWASQRDFQLDVLTSAVAHVPGQNFKTFSTAASDALADLSLATEDDRWRATREVTRRGMNASIDSTADHELLVALRFLCSRIAAASPHAKDELEPVIELVRQTRRDTTALYVEMVMFLTTALGLRLRADHGMSFEGAARTLSVVSTSTATGLEIDAFVDHDLPEDMPTGPNGESQRWSAVAIAAWAMVSFLFEPDPNFTAPD